MAPDAKMFAVGRSIRQAGTPTTGADFAIANVGGQGGASPNEQYALSVQVDEIDGSWKIVSLAHATVPLVPEVYVWYTPWAEVFPPSS